MLLCTKHRPTSWSRWVCRAASWADREHRRETGCGTGEQGTRLQLGSAVFAVGVGLLPCCEQASCGPMNFETRTRHQVLIWLPGHERGSKDTHVCWSWERGTELSRAELALRDPGMGLTLSLLDPTAVLPSSTHPAQMSGTLVTQCLHSLP